MGSGVRPMRLLMTLLAAGYTGMHNTLSMRMDVDVLSGGESALLIATGSTSFIT